MISQKDFIEEVCKMCNLFGFKLYWDINVTDLALMFKIEDQHGNVIDTIKNDRNSFTKDALDKIYDKLSNMVPIERAKKPTTGWRPISEYSRDKYDWVLVKYFDGSYECVPEVAEMRVDDKWYNRAGALIDPDIFDMKYFFDMQQLDSREV